jgi:uncharacterized protein
LPTAEVGGNNSENNRQETGRAVKDLLRYDQMVECAMRGVVREALARTAANGLPGAHHFYITFKTRAPGVSLAAHLAQKYPVEMTIVLEHQFWDLAVREHEFDVTLSFNNRPERITIPFAAIAAFADPSVKFGLQFPAADAGAEIPNEAKPGTETGKPKAAEKQPELALTKTVGKRDANPSGKPGEVVALDAFRKK